MTALEKIKEFFSHKSLRDMAYTLNCYNLVEIGVVVWFTYEIHTMLEWYRGFISLEYFNGVAYWGAIGSTIAVIIGAMKYMHDTLKNHDKNG